jgi:hypothetical protein
LNLFFEGGNFPFRPSLRRRRDTKRYHWRRRGRRSRRSRSRKAASTIVFSHRHTRNEVERIGRREL